MNVYKIKLHKTFYNSLKKQLYSICEFNYNYSNKFLLNCYKIITSLKFFPNGYQRIENTIYRKIALNKNYVIIYLVDNTHKIVYIQYIFSTKQDYLKLIS